jgi:hypothetical protein
MTRIFTIFFVLFFIFGCGSKSEECIDCDDEDESVEEIIPATGRRCVQIEDHRNQVVPIEQCTFRRNGTLFEPEPSPENCPEEELFLDTEVGTVKLSAKCTLHHLNDEGEVWEVGRIEGRLAIPIPAMAPDEPPRPYVTQLIGSLCHDGFPMEVDKWDNPIFIQDHLGFSDGIECANPLTPSDVHNAKLNGILLDCSREEGACNPADGDDYIAAHGEQGQSDGRGHSLALSYEVFSDKIPEGENKSVLLIPQLFEQWIPFPIKIEGTDRS